MLPTNQDYTDVQHRRYIPDLECSKCDYETIFDNFYRIDGTENTQEEIDNKLNKKEICTKCGSKLLRV